MFILTYLQAKRKNDIGRIMGQKKRSWLRGIVIIGLVGLSSIKASQAYFGKFIVSEGNVIKVANLDMKVGGKGAEEKVSLRSDNFVPGDKMKTTWKIDNVGNLDGYLDIENIQVNNKENGCQEPEQEAGDTSCDNPGEEEGELEDKIEVKWVIEKDCNEQEDSGDVVVYEGKLDKMPQWWRGDYLLKEGETICSWIETEWPPTEQDSQAMGDEVDIKFIFELGQTQEQ